MNNYTNLDFTKIKEILKSYATFDNVKNSIDELHIIKDEYILNDLLNNVNEAKDIHSLLGKLPLSKTFNILNDIKKANAGGVLNIEELWNIHLVLDNIDALVKYFNSYENDIVYLLDLVNGLDYDYSLNEDILRCIENDLTISDHASPTLFSIRKKIKNIESSIRKQMDKELKKASDYLEIDNISTKNDHFVLPVKAQYKNNVKGIIHATSASKSTVYIEPLFVTEMNNELNTLRSEEIEEIHKILLQLSTKVKRAYYPLKYNQEILNELDFIFAKAHFAYEYNCVRPTINSDHLVLKDARHPLIDQKKVVSNDIILDKQVLMITGSNTGGKTVTLKTAGLFSLMALSGLLVPSSEAHIPMFDEIYMDVGDEQSIEASLSTFSSHLKRLNHIISHSTSSSLILIDEIGSGTDPREGAALGKAIIEYLINKGATILMSTHYGELKTFGEINDNIDLASVGFDVETMKPTYKLKLHSVGLSYAFEIAKALGMNDDILQKGLFFKEESISKEEKLMETLELREKMIEEKEEEIKLLLEENQALNTKYKNRMKSIEKEKDAIIKKAREDANVLLDESKAYIEEIAKDLKEKATLKDHEIINAKKQLNDLKYKEKKKVKKQDHIFNKGDRVLVDSMNREGEVLEVTKNNDVVILLNGMPVRLKNTDITYIGKKIKPVKKAKTSQKIAKTGSYEVNVIGMRYNEAMEIVDKFIDDALMLGYPSIRIIHGMGTGALRKGVRQMIQKKSFVDSYRDGGPNEGGLGATLVYFK